MQEDKNILARITIDPNKRGGKPCIKGTRITVNDILSYLISGMTIDEILADFSHISNEDIIACFAYCLTKLENNLE